MKTSEIKKQIESGMILQDSDRDTQITKGITGFVLIVRGDIVRVGKFTNVFKGFKSELVGTMEIV